MQQADNFDQPSTQSAELLYLMVKNIRDYAIFMLDTERRVISWNPGVEKLLGYTESEIVGQPGDIIFTAEDRAEGAPAQEQETALSEGSAEDTRWHVRLDGSRFWANGMMMPLKNEDGTLRGFAKVMRDYTAQKRAEENLEQILSSVTDAFYRFDRDFRYAYVNQATTEMFGISETEFLGKTLWEIFPDVEGNRFHREVSRALDEGKATVFENYYQPLDRWFENRVYPSVDGLSVFTTEITERKRAETALRESEEKYRTLFEAIDEGFCIIEMLYDEAGKAFDYRFLEINPSFENQTGLKDAIGKTVREFAPEHEEHWFEIYGRVASTGEPVRFENFAHQLNRWYDVFAFRIGAPDLCRVAVLFSDITGQKETEESLRRSHAQSNEILESISDAFYALDKDFYFIYVNQKAEELWGRERAALIGKHYLTVFPEAAGGESYQMHLEASEEQKSIHYETLSPILNRWKDVSIYPNKSGALSVYFRDIEERKRNEAALRESRETLRLAMSGSRMGAWSRNLLTDKVYWSAELEAIFGLPAGTFSGTLNGFYDYVYAADKEPIAVEVQRAIAERRSYIIEFRYHHPDGDGLRWMEGRGHAVYSATGEPTEMYGIGIDITMRKRAEINARFLAEVSQDLVKVSAAEEIVRTVGERLNEFLGISMCAFVEISETADTATINYEWRKEDAPSLLGVYNLHDFVTLEFLQAATAGEPIIIPDIKTDPRIADPEQFARLRIGAHVNVPLIRNGEWRFSLCVYHTNTYNWQADEVELLKELSSRVWTRLERSFVEQEREELLGREQAARFQAEEASRLKDEFLATLSHELRTPLNAILGWSQILQNQNLAGHDAQKALVTIERNARSQSQLIDDLLDVSRIITGKLRLDVRAVDLTSVISAAVDAARPAAEAKNIRLQTLLDPKAAQISGDPDRLQQVIWNLLSNAIKFTPKNGRVQVRLERVNSHIEIVVSDTGAGIEPEFLPFVFERFRQSDGSMTRRHGGLGLGLAIVRQLVELHGGSVAVESAGAGAGTIFIVALPLLPVRQDPVVDGSPRIHPAARNNPAADCPPELSGLRVLLVDDEADSRDLLKFVLESCGAHITTAASAAEAMGKITSEKFDVLISDIGMPEEDGFSLIRKIRKLSADQGGAVPAIALTAYARAEDRVQALRSGFQIHVAKPVESSELIAAVANLAGGARMQQESESQL